MSSRALELIAHRGASREFPENSLPAFQRAFARGADAIELDVHATRDAVVVVHHDPVLRVSGAPAIADLLWSDLRTMQLAPGICVPRLADVLEVTPPAAMVYIELKGTGVEGAVVDVVRAGHSRCAVHSFDHEMIIRAAALAPEIRRGILFETYPPDVGAEMRRTGARDVWPNWQLIDGPLVRAVHANDGRVMAWTVNAKSTVDRLTELGVDGLCTDDVRVLNSARL